MKLFGFGKKEEEKVPTCACNSGDRYDLGQIDVTGSIQNIKVLGSGCKSCHQLLENTRIAVRALNLPIVPEYVTDIERIMGYGVMSMPALVVHDKVVSMGRVLSADEIVKLLREREDRE